MALNTHIRCFLIFANGHQEQCGHYHTGKCILFSFPSGFCYTCVSRFRLLFPSVQREQPLAKERHAQANGSMISGVDYGCTRRWGDHDVASVRSTQPCEWVAMAAPAISQWLLANKCTRASPTPRRLATGTCCAHGLATLFQFPPPCWLSGNGRFTSLRLSLSCCYSRFITETQTSYICDGCQRLRPCQRSCQLTGRWDLAQWLLCLVKAQIDATPFCRRRT
jgi:hypothetical protein